MPRGATQWYVVPARDAVPSGGVTGLRDMTITQWEADRQLQPPAAAGLGR